MLDRSRALQILGLREGADESEAAVAFRALRRHVQARERAAADDAERAGRAEELRDLERAWRALSSLPVPTGIIQPTRPPKALGLAPRWLLGWAIAATLLAAVLGFALLTAEQGFGPLALVDGSGSGGSGGEGPGFALPGAEGEAAEESGGADSEVLEAGPRTELVVESSVEGASLLVRTRGDAPEIVAQGDADGSSIWLSPGAYAVEVRHPDCRDAWQEDLDVNQGQARARLAAEPCQDTGWMVVRSNVADDELTIDGEKVGATGETRHPVVPGEHEVRVAKSGYQPWEGIVEVEPGQVLGIRPRLVAVQKTSRKPRPKKPQPQPQQAAGGAPPQGQANPQRAERENEREYSRWHEDARRWLLARYDYDRSGLLDSRDEIEPISCETWLGLEQSYDQSRLGLSLTRFYGFDGARWRSGALGIADETRDLAYERMQACGLR